MSTYCPPVGPRDAKVVVVGEFPTDYDCMERVPFSGPAGKLFDQSLRSAGLCRNEIYFTYVCKTKPTKGDASTFYERTKAGKPDPRRAKPTAYLQEQIDSFKLELGTLNPNVILLSGSESLRATLNLRGIQDWRGSILSSHWGKCIPTLNPVDVLRDYKDRVLVDIDIKRASDEAKTHCLNLPTMEFLLVPNYDTVLRFLSSVNNIFAFDIETTSNHVRCLAISTKRNSAICIPFMCKNGQSAAQRLSRNVGVEYSNGLTSYWSNEEEFRILEKLNELFSNPNIEKVAQNFPFDSTVLASEFGFEIRGKVHDTMLKHHVVYPELRKSLDFLCSIYTRIPYYSNYDAKDDYSTWKYNCYDAAVTFEVNEVLDIELKDSKLDVFYEGIPNPTMLAMTRAQNRGVLIDLVERKKQREMYDEKIKTYTEKLKEITQTPDLNPNSPKQMANLLYDKLGLAPVRHHKTKAITTGKDALESLAKKYTKHAELFDTLRNHSSATTLRDGFLSKELGNDSRIRTSFNIAGTVTGRLTSSESFLYPSTNLQNIQKPGSGTMRRCFIASPGRVLLKADLSQAEFRIVVWLAKIVRIIQRYKVDPDFDVHRWVASIIYRKEEKDVIKTERDIAKNGVYGGNYKMYYVTAARTYKLPLDIAKFVLEEYRRAIPEIPKWWDTVDDEIRRTRTSTSPFGRRRLFLDRVDDDMFRSAYSSKAQSIVADVINRAAILADEFFDEKECPLLLQVHDELVFEVDEDKVMEYALAVKQLMEFPLVFEGVEEPMLIPADVSYGKNWYDQKKIEFKT